MKIKLYLCILIFIVICGGLQAQAPLNDNCNTASNIDNNCATTVAATTVGATPSPFDPGCTTTDADDDVWFRFTANAVTMDLNITNAQFTSGGDATLGVALYTGPCVDISEISCTSEGVTGNGKVTFSSLTINATYSVRVWTNGTANTASFEICASPAVALAVRLFDYYAFCNNGQAIIAWMATAEIDNRSFVLEKSLDGINFKVSATIPAETAITESHTYTITDPEINAGKAFYRIKQIDNSGSSVYFKVLLVDCNRTRMSMYPNPVKDILVLQVNPNTVWKQIKLFDANGRMAKEMHLNINHASAISVNVTTIVKGVYWLYATDANGNVESIRFIKN